MLPRFKGRTRLAIVVACVLSLALTWAFSLRPAWVERFYSGAVGSLITRVLSSISGIVPFSLAEIVGAALVAGGILAGIRAIVSVRRGQRTRLSVLRGGLLNVATVLLILLASFYVLWGLNYYRPALSTRLGWDGGHEATPAGDAALELEQWSRALIGLTNDAYETAYGTTRAGSSTGPVPLDEIDAAIEDGFRRIAGELGAPDWAASRGRAKPLRLSPLLSRLNIGGIYLPWTSEASFNAMLPDVSLPHTIAHEKAHQRGLASEDEASFVGFLAAIRSDEPYVRYSGLLYGQRRLLSELYRLDPERAVALTAERIEGVQDDVEAIREFWSRFRGPLRATGKKINDTYLKLHGVEEGIESYALSSRLILLWIRNEGGVSPGSRAEAGT